MTTKAETILRAAIASYRDMGPTREARRGIIRLWLALGAGERAAVGRFTRDACSGSPLDRFEMFVVAATFGSNLPAWPRHEGSKR